MPPTSLLAKLDDFKNDGGWSGTETDDRLRRYLARASSMAERLAGLPDGGLRRRKDRVEYPGAQDHPRYMLNLNARAIESVSEVVQLYAPGTEDQFDAATPLVEITDYIIESAELATLRRLYRPWHRSLPRCIRATYTAGLADPARISVALAAATWTESTQTLTEVGAFADYTFTAGDQIIIAPGSDATAGVYPVASRTSDDAIVLAESISPNGSDLTAVTSAYADMTDPPDDLQEGVIRQAMLLRNTSDTAGLEKVDLGEAGGSFTTRATKPHKALIDAVQRYRRLM